MMEAKETVMSQTEATKYIDRWLNGEIEARHVTALIAEAQAEISFKAGYKQRKMEENPVVLGTDYKAGIREVVEWIKTERKCRYIDNVLYYPVYENALEVKLEEWGIEKK